MVINVPILVNCSSEFTQGGCKIISTLRAYEATCWLTLILTSFKTVGILLFDALIALIVEPVHAIYQGLPLSIRQLNVLGSCYEWLYLHVNLFTYIFFIVFRPLAKTMNNEWVFFFTLLTFQKFESHLRKKYVVFKPEISGFMNHAHTSSVDRLSENFDHKAEL